MTKFLLSLFLVLSFSLVNAQNNSLYFDGSDDHISLPDDDIFDLTNDFTLEAWIYADEWQTNVWEGTIIGKDQDPNTGFVLRTGANGTLSFTVGTGAWTEVTSGPVMSEQTWHHVAAVLTGGESKIYVDGILVGTGPCPASLSSSTNILIGESSGFSGRIFEGRIDEVRIWNIVRTNEEIATDRSIDLPNTTPGLIAYYKLDEITGDIAENHMTPGTNDGTLLNFNPGSWQEGYEVPGFDIKTDAIISPDAVTLSGGAAQVKARFLNNGIDAISSFEVSYVFNGGEPFSETVNIELQPGEFYIHTFQSVVLSNGATDELAVSAALTDDGNTFNDDLSATYSASELDLNIPIFVEEQHSFGSAGQTHVTNVSLPENNSSYEQILMNISVDCPTGGCDPWDQPAKVSLQKNGITYEIARYITPYGIGCGPWTVDVTSFKSVLQGDCEFISYVQVWGGSGWLVNLSLSYIPGNVENAFQKVTPVYISDYVVYGEPTISHDLATMTIPIDPQTVAADYRLTVSGHGQANTNNAAEFSNFTHSVVVNGTEFQEHNLWNDDCSENDCSNQAGSWLFDRAGWCPGEAVDPLLVDITSEISAGNDIELDYELQDYTNLLNTGYNGGSHTEPHYRLHAFLVEKGPAHYAEGGWINGTAVSINSPATPVDLSATTTISIAMTNTGTTLIDNITFKAYINGELTLEETYIVDVGIFPGDSYTHTFIETVDMSSVDENYNLSVLVSALGDEAANDNVLNSSFIFVGIDELTTLDLGLYPNPNNGEVVMVVPNLLGPAQVIISDISGRIIDRFETSNGALSGGLRLSTPFAPGTYLVEVIAKEGKISQRMVVE